MIPSYLKLIALILLAALATAPLPAAVSTEPSTLPATAPSVTTDTSSSAPSPATLPAEASAPTTQLSCDVLAAAEDLNSDEFSVRQSAQKKLVDMGDAVEPQLRALLLRDFSHEARARVQAALKQIEDARRIGPASITMHYTNAPLQNVLDDFARQAGADLGCRRAPIVEYAKNKPVTINLDHASFWESLRMIGEVSELRPRFNNNDPQMLLEIAPSGGPPMELNGPGSKHAGPFLIVPRMCTINRVVQYTRGGLNRSNLYLRLTALAEPKIHVINQTNPDWLQECVDEKGHSLLADNQTPMFFNNGREWSWELQCELKELPDMGQKIARLRGELKFVLETKSEVVSINDLAKLGDIARTVDGNTITLRDFSTANGQYQLHLSLVGPAAGIQNWNFLRDVLAAIQVLGDDGEIIHSEGMSTSSGPQGFDITLLYANTNRNGQGAGVASPIPRKLRWDVKLESRLIDVPFELTNLNLPHVP
ncbi:MAG: hypothetical protein M3O30_05740 [Planctomycetota bacterium]|nr:hypothetical protein [Planctomycetota bacterium]